MALYKIVMYFTDIEEEEAAFEYIKSEFRKACIYYPLCYQLLGIFVPF